MGFLGAHKKDAISKTCLVSPQVLIFNVRLVVYLNHGTERSVNYFGVYMVLFMC